MKIGILGAGAYALALSQILNDNNHQITIWTDFLEEKELLTKTRTNPKKLPDFYLADDITVTTSIEEIVCDKDLLIFAIPAQFTSSVCSKMKEFIKDSFILIASKGIDTKSLSYMDEIIKENLNTQNIAVLSGPTFAKDLLKREQIGLSIAYKNQEIKEKVSSAFVNNYVHLDFTEDIVGVEICGSLKNIYAIAMGVLEGLSCHESTKAMFMTQIIKEIGKFLEEFSSNKTTINTYAGIGDLLLTCTSKKSRNYSFGTLLGSKASREETKKYLEETTVEGVHTLKAVISIIENSISNYPIIDTLNKIINHKLSPEKILESFK